MTDLYLRGAAVLAILAALFFGWKYIDDKGYERGVNESKAAIERIKRDASDTLATEIQKTRNLEKALQVAKDTQELKDAKSQTAVANLRDRVRNLTDAAGRLFDPHAPAGCGASGSSAPGEAAAAPSAGPTDRAQTGGLLSAELSGLLQRLQLEADTINTAYASCRADAYTVRALQPAP